MQHVLAKIAKWSAALMSGVAFTACGIEDIKWTEDVRLPDGRVVNLTRYEAFGGNYEPTQTPTTSESWLEFVHPDTKEKVRYEGTQFYSTVALFIHEKSAYLVLNMYLGGPWHGCPTPPYSFIRFEKGKWQRVEYAGVPIKQITQNMILGAKGREKQIREKRHIEANFLSTQGRPLDGLKKIDITGLDKQIFKCPNGMKPLPFQAERKSS